MFSVRRTTRRTKETIGLNKGKKGSIGINCTIRREMGSDINAACGQLRRSHTTKENSNREEE